MSAAAVKGMAAAESAAMSAAKTVSALVLGR
jgi:hypothetical protein